MAAMRWGIYHLDTHGTWRSFASNLFKWAFRPLMGNDVRVSVDSFQGQLFGPSAGQAATLPSPWRVQIFSGAAMLAAMRPMLAELGRRTGQTAALKSLEYLLGAPTMRGKIPCLVLVGLAAGVEWEDATAETVQGAVLLHQYRFAGRGAGIFATHDLTGQRTVFAPVELRRQVAEAAGAALAAQGAWMTLITVEATQEAERQPLLPACHSDRFRVAGLLRAVPRDLPVGHTIEATLARLGKRTRRNLRYYRRRVEIDLGAAFVPCVEMGREEFLKMNRESTNPGSEADARWRYECLEDGPERMFAGVRSADGRWLSLIGGRRHNGLTEIEWQMNRAGLARYSLSTVMRAYLLEHEVELGTEKLTFQGGTPHSIRNSLVPSQVLDLVVVKRSPMGWLLQRLARWVFPTSNYFGTVLRDKRLVWMS